METKEIPQKEYKKIIDNFKKEIWDELNIHQMTWDEQPGIYMGLTLKDFDTPQKERYKEERFYPMPKETAKRLYNEWDFKLEELIIKVAKKLNKLS